MREGSELPRLMVLLHAYNKENRADIYVRVNNAGEGPYEVHLKLMRYNFSDGTKTRKEEMQRHQMEYVRCWWWAGVYIRSYQGVY